MITSILRMCTIYSWNFLWPKSSAQIGWWRRFLSLAMTLGVRGLVISCLAISSLLISWNFLSKVEIITLFVLLLRWTTLVTIILAFLYTWMEIFLWKKISTLTHLSKKECNTENMYNKLSQPIRNKILNWISVYTIA